jgi:hypothetical protein
MYDQVLDTFRKAAESTMQLQQEMFRNWTHQWTQMPMTTAPAGMNLGMGWVDQIRAFQKTWGAQVTEMLSKHREALDTQYKAGIKTIAEAFKVTDARDPEHFRRLTEELWKQSFETLKTLSESQTREFQTVSEKWFEVVSKGVQQATKV